MRWLYIILFLLTTEFAEAKHKSYFGSSCCGSVDPYSYKNIGGTPSCTGGDCANWAPDCDFCDGNYSVTYSCSSFQNDFLNPTVQFGIHCCGANTLFGPNDNVITLSVDGYTGDLPGVPTCPYYSASFSLIAATDFMNTNPNFAGIGPVNVSFDYMTAGYGGNTPLSMACAGAANNSNGMTSQENAFYVTQCNNLGYSAGNLQLSCPANPSTSAPLMCKLVIACWVMQITNSETIESGCSFIKFPPSPPPFCCATPMPPQNPTTFPICADGTNATATVSCAPTSPTGNAGSQISSSYFTPAIRVAFDVVPNIFQAVSPWTNGGSASYTGPTPSNGIHTVPSCTATGASNCVSGVSLPASAKPPANFEAIFTNSANGALTRNSYNGQLFGINLGQYCDLNYSLASNSSLGTSSCSIIDMYGNPQSFYAKLQPATNPSQICAYNSTTKTQIGCATIPYMSLPAISTCSGQTNSPKKFCMNVSFKEGYSGQIQGASNSIAAQTTTLQTFPGKINGTNIPITAIVTDENYNIPDANGNLCLNDSGQPVTPCPPAHGAAPGGLWYNGGAYMGGGTQFCFIPTSLSDPCDPNCTANCNCVLASKVTQTTTPQGGGAAKTNTFTSQRISDRLSPPPATALPLQSYYAVSPGSAAPPAGQATRGMNSLELGVCLPLPPPYNLINCGELASAVSGFAMYNGKSFVDQGQITQYTAACQAYTNYCSQAANFNQCYQDYTTCSNSKGQSPPSTTPSGITLPTPIAPTGVDDPSALNICGFFMEDGNCNDGCGSFTYCIDQGYTAANGSAYTHTCQASVTCNNASPESCTENDPPPLVKFNWADCSDFIANLFPNGNSGVSQQGPGSYCLNNGTWNYVDKGQLYGYTGTCTAFQAYCNQSAVNNAECAKIYKDCAAGNVPLPPTAITTLPGILHSPMTASWLSVCGFFSKTSDCSTCGSATFCCDQGYNAVFYCDNSPVYNCIYPTDCLAYVTCANPAAQDCIETDP